MDRRELLLMAGAGAVSAACSSTFANLWTPPMQDESLPDFTLRIGHVTQELAPGITIKTTGYNNSIPGPLLRMKEGVPVEIDVFNDTEVPDLVHWHGLAIDPANDGAMEEGSRMIEPHAKLRYRFTPNPAGSRWYHSHSSARLDANRVDLRRASYSGKFGFLYVAPRNDDGHYDHEVFLAVHHWEPSLMPMGDMYSGCPVTYKYASFNGKLLSATEPLKVKKGDRVLFHFLNASATQNVSLALPGHAFRVVALDGNAVPNPQQVSVVSLAVAERVDAIVEMNFPGVWILGDTTREGRDKGLGLPVEYAGSAGPALWTSVESSDWAYTKFGRSPIPVVPDHAFAMRFEKIPGENGLLDRWTINGRSFPDIDALRVHQGARYRFSFLNTSNEAHPVHIHRHSFEVVNIAGKGSSGIMKDVISVESFHKVEVDMIANNPGLTLLHCHHQLHMDYGFMQMLQYV